MTIYLVRHGQDDESVRGGWSQQGLIEEGIQQIHALGQQLSQHTFEKIIVSDLPRTKQTADILTSYLTNSPVCLLSKEWREMKNGKLAGMKNSQTEIDYPGLYYRTLKMDEKYPDGESPNDFYERIKAAWENIQAQKTTGDVLIVTHGGVINIIFHLLHDLPYTNQEMYFPVGTGTITAIDESFSE